MNTRALAAAATALIVAACPSEPEVTPPTTQAEPATLEAKAVPAAAQGGAAVHGESGLPPAARGAEAPNDAVHAGLRTAAPRGGDLPAGHPPVGGPPPSSDLPAGHPALGGAPTPAGAHGAAPSAPAPAPQIETGQALPLHVGGPGGAGELTRVLGELAKAGVEEPVRQRIDQAFRKTFTAKREGRDYKGAATLLQGLETGETTAAVAHRVLGYVALNTGFDMAGATNHYKKAVELSPSYGEAHYALAFMYVRDNADLGSKHLARAMELGVKDTRGLASQLGPAKTP